MRRSEGPSSSLVRPDGGIVEKMLTINGAWMPGLNHQAAHISAFRVPPSPSNGRDVPEGCKPPFLASLHSPISREASINGSVT